MLGAEPRLLTAIGASAHVRWCSVLPDAAGWPPLPMGHSIIPGTPIPSLKPPGLCCGLWSREAFWQRAARPPHLLQTKSPHPPFPPQDAAGPSDGQWSLPSVTLQGIPLVASGHSVCFVQAASARASRPAPHLRFRFRRCSD